MQAPWHSSVPLPRYRVPPRPDERTVLLPSSLYRAPTFTTQASPGRDEPDMDVSNSPTPARVIITAGSYLTVLLLLLLQEKKIRAAPA